MPDAAVMTAADIARLAGVTRATVSNWRRRHPDFPEPCGGTEASPAYDRQEVEAWLAARGSLPELPLAERLWRDVLEVAGDADLGDTVAWAAQVVQAASASHSPHPQLTQPMAHRTGRHVGDLARELTEMAAKLGPSEIVRILIGKFAENTGRSALATPRPVADLMAELGGTANGTVLDPACGTGELLASAADHGAVRVLGQEIDAGLARLAKLQLDEFVRAGTAEVKAGDSLHGDRLAGLQADVVLCHPPFGNRDWGQEELAGDPRWQYGTPPKSEPELAWAQHALAHLHPGGRAVLLMPPAAASRPSGRRIRAEMLRRGAMRAIVCLPPGAVYPRHVPVHVWVLEHPAGEGPSAPRMLLVDASAGPGEAGAGSPRPPAGWQRLRETVLTAWDSFTTDSAADRGEPGLWCVARGIDLLDETVDLTPARHVGAGQGGTPPSEAAAAVRIIRGRLRTALRALEDSLPGDDMLPCDQAPRWRTASLAELSHSKMVSFHRASSAAPADADLTARHELPDGWPVLTVTDVLHGEPPSAAVPSETVKPEWLRISCGDVIIPAGAAGPVVARVATDEDDDAVLGRNLHLIRPDPARIDPWFLSGFLTSPDNIQQASYGSTSIRIDARRLTVPLLPMPEQRSYAEAFRALHSFDAASREFTRLSATLTRLLARSIAEGGLRPDAGTGSMVATTRRETP